MVSNLNVKATVYYQYYCTKLNLPYDISLFSNHHVKNIHTSRPVDFRQITHSTKHVVVVVAENKNHQGSRHPTESFVPVHFEGVPMNSLLEDQQHPDETLPGSNTPTQGMPQIVVAVDAVEMIFIS